MYCRRPKEIAVGNNNDPLICGHCGFNVFEKRKSKNGKFTRFVCR